MAQNLTDLVRRDFVRYHKERNFSEIVELLNGYLADSQLPTDEKAWALWNICDALAVQDLPDEQLPYHRRFFELACNEMPDEKFHWVVSDSTQSIALADGGHLNEWIGWYQKAKEQAPHTQNNRNVRFQAHRTAINTSIITRECELGYSAFQAITELLNEDLRWNNRDYALCNYQILRVEHDIICGDGSVKSEAFSCLKNQLSEWISKYREPLLKDDLRAPLHGTWEQLNFDLPPAIIKIVLWNAGTVACRVGEYQTSLDLCDKAMALGGRPTPYGRTLHIIALWKVHQDRDQIQRELRADPQPVASELQRFAPELLEFL